MSRLAGAGATVLFEGTVNAVAAGIPADATFFEASACVNSTVPAGMLVEDTAPRAPTRPVPSVAGIPAVAIFPVDVFPMSTGLIRLPTLADATCLRALAAGTGICALFTALLFAGTAVGVEAAE